MTICCGYKACSLQDIVQKHKKLLTFHERGIIIGLYKHEQRLPHRKGSFVRCLSLTREWGKENRSPALTNTVCTEEDVRWRKPVIGGNLEKAGLNSVRGASRETYCVVRMLLSEWLWWCFICFGTCIITVFIFVWFNHKNGMNPSKKARYCTIQ